MSFGSDGEGEPDGVGFIEVLDGICALEPARDPDDEDADGAFPVWSRWKNRTRAAITATTGMIR